jgi:hypothetical protein
MQNVGLLPHSLIALRKNTVQCMGNSDRWIASRIRTNRSTHFTLGRNTGIPDRVIMPSAAVFCFKPPFPTHFLPVKCQVLFCIKLLRSFLSCNNLLFIIIITVTIIIIINITREVYL